MFLKSDITSEQILTGSIRRTLFAMTVPTALALSLNAMFNFVDRLYIAAVGDIEFAALGMAFIIQALILALANGIGTGISTCLATAIGSDNKKICNDIGRLAVLLVVLASIFTAIVGTSTVAWQVSILDMSKPMGIHYKVYLMVIFAGSFSIYAPVIFNSILVGEGNMTIPMHVMIVAALTNMILDPILIFGLATIPAMGIEGAAIATIIARTVATVWAIWAVCKHSQHVTVFKHFSSIKQLFKFETGLAQVSKNVAAVAFPISLATMLEPIVLGAYYKLLAPYGDPAKIVLTMGLTYLILIMFPIMGLARSANTMCAQNIAAKNHNRSSEIYKISLTMSFLFVATLSCIFVLFGDVFLGAFMSSTHGSEFTKLAIICFAISYPLNAMFSIQASYLISNSLSAHVFLLNLLTVLYCGLVYVLQLYLGEKGVWAGMVLSSAISVVHAFLIIHFYIEKKQNKTAHSMQNSPLKENELPPAK